MKINPDLLRVAYRYEFTKEVKEFRKNFFRHKNCVYHGRVCNVDEIGGEYLHKMYHNIYSILINSETPLLSGVSAYKQLCGDRDLDVDKMKNESLIDFIAPNELHKCSLVLRFLNNCFNNSEFSDYEKDVLFVDHLDVKLKEAIKITSSNKYLRNYNEFDLDNNSIIKYTKNALKICLNFSDIVALKTFLKECDEKLVSNTTKKNNQKKLFEERKKFFEKYRDFYLKKLVEYNVECKEIDITKLFHNFLVAVEKYSINAEHRVFPVFFIYLLKEAPEMLNSKDILIETKRYQMMREILDYEFEEQAKKEVENKTDEFDLMNVDAPKGFEYNGRKMEYAESKDERDFKNILRRTVKKIGNEVQRLYNKYDYKIDYSTPYIKALLIEQIVKDTIKEEVNLKAFKNLIRSAIECNKMKENKKPKEQIEIKEEIKNNSNKTRYDDVRCPYESKFQQMEDD